MKEPFDSILSNKSKKLKKEADSKMYFDNTHDTMGLYKNPKITKEGEGSDEEEKEKSQPKGKALLKRVYGGSCWKDYEQFGMKNKSGKKQVPNCIPKKKKGGKIPEITKTKTESENKKDILPDNETSLSFEEELDNLDIESEVRPMVEWLTENSGMLPKRMADELFYELEEISKINDKFIDENTLNTTELRRLTERIDNLQNGINNAELYIEDNLGNIAFGALYNPERTWGEFGQQARSALRHFTGFGRNSLNPNGRNSLNPKRVIKNYSKIIGHLEEHLAEKAGDPKDASQSKMLKKEVQNIKTEGSIPVSKLTKKDNLYKVSNARKVQQKAKELFGKDTVIYKSDKPNKKYKILNPKGKFIYFGDAKMDDFNKHQDEKRRRRYIARASKIRGNWRTDPYSPNFLSLVLLWNADLSEIV